MNLTIAWCAVALLLVAVGAIATIARRRARALRRSEEQYRLLFEANPHPMWVFDFVSWHFLAVNSAAVESYGYSAEEFLGMTIREIRPAEDIAQLMQDIGQASGGLRNAGVWRHRKRDGSIILAEVSTQPLSFNGRLACMVLAIDVTAREHTRRENEVQRARLVRQAELIDLSNDAIVAATADRVIKTWNSGAEKLYGWSKTEAIGRVFGDLLQTPPENTAEIDAALQHQLRWEGELVQRRRDGRPVTVDSRQVMLRDPAGNPGWILSINRDVTAHRELEEQLRQAQKLESIGHLAGGVAHDFNNLMTIVSGYAGMAMEEIPADHPVRDSLLEISQAAGRATALTRQLLTFSRRQLRSVSRVDLNEVARDMEKLLRRWIGEDTVLRLLPDSAPAVVLADRSHIEQVMMNLVINARDAMPQGGAITVRTERIFVDDCFAAQHLSLKAGWYVQLSVTDTGVGMPPDVRQKCFEPFFTTKGAGSGTGLGLSTVYGIVKQSEGAILVDSELGRGSTFRIFLPAVEGPACVTAPAVEPAALAGTETILVVEDEDSLRKYVKDTLERQGYHVVSAANGREALQFARTASPQIDLLLTDMVMPEMNGSELAEAFAHERPRVPVLRMTGYSDRLTGAESALDYVQKPFTPATLLTRIRAMLANTGNN